MAIDYNHSENLHTVEGSQTAFPILFPHEKPSSLLDVGCGKGTWLKAASDFGISDIFGVDGVDIPKDQLLFPPDRFRCHDLTKPWDLGRRFAAALCLEVAEHLDKTYSETLVDALVKHADVIIFSAACPGQPGQHHVNCQWPTYWQGLFNEHGYICTDEVRWRMWDEIKIEPWYRQNLFLARRNPEGAGQESRIRSVVHPEIWESQIRASSGGTFEEHVHQIEQGRMPVLWHLTMPARSLWTKFNRKLK